MKLKREFSGGQGVRTLLLLSFWVQCFYILPILLDSVPGGNEDPASWMHSQIQKTKTPQTLKRKINKVKWNWRLRNAESHACVLTSMQLKNWEASFPQRPDLQKKETYLLTNDYMHRIPPHPQAKELTVGTLAGLPRLCTPCLQALNRLAYNFATACVSQLAIPLLSLNKLNFW